MKTVKIETTHTYRVYRIEESLRSAMKAARAKQGLTVATFLSRAVRSELPSLVKQLQALGIRPKAKGRPARLPMADDLLDLLREASQETAIPASFLLQACLNVAVSRKPAKRARSR